MRSLLLLLGGRGIALDADLALLGIVGATLLGFVAALPAAAPATGAVVAAVQCISGYSCPATEATALAERILSILVVVVPAPVVVVVAGLAPAVVVAVALAAAFLVAAVSAPVGRPLHFVVAGFAASFATGSERAAGVVAALLALCYASLDRIGRTQSKNWTRRILHPLVLASEAPLSAPGSMAPLPVLRRSPSTALMRDRYD